MADARSLQHDAARLERVLWALARASSADDGLSALLAAEAQLREMVQWLQMSYRQVRIASEECLLVMASSRGNSGGVIRQSREQLLLLQPSERITAMTEQDHERPTIEPLLVRVEDAARILSLSRSTIYEMMDSGELPSVRREAARRIPMAALRAWIEQQLMQQTLPDSTS